MHRRVGRLNRNPNWDINGDHILSYGSISTSSGSSITFSDLPPWIKRVTVVFNGVSLDGAGDISVQLGDSVGIETTGYVSTALLVINAAATSGGSSTTSFHVKTNGASAALSGNMIIDLLSTNNWVASHTVSADTSHVGVGGGRKTLSDTLTQIQVSPSAGNFDGGSINLLYE